jgi:hypothetical protein
MFIRDVGLSFPGFSSTAVSQQSLTRSQYSKPALFMDLLHMALNQVQLKKKIPYVHYAAH